MITKEILDTYEMTIGIECHVQLATKTKLFSGSDNDARDKEPNAATSPIDFGLPGMLPVLNKEAVALAARAGKALNSEIATLSRFDRKHYFYPDLPKGYQMTQMYEPIILSGHVDAPLEDGSVVRVRIHHAHLEEDAGKLTHHAGYSLVDLNRAGTPLIEIVSEPDIHSPAAAKAYAAELHLLMTYAGATIGDLSQGNMRFDVNISVAKKGSEVLGTRAEVKNLNSFRSVERAAQYEFERQVAVIESGEQVVQETRGWDDAKGKTSSQRSKEDAQDYRYMPDADVPPVVLTEEEIRDMQAPVGHLPAYYREKWQTLDLDRSVVESIISKQAYAVLIDAVYDTSGADAARRVAHWFSSALGSSEESGTIVVSNLVPAGYIELSDMVADKKLSSTAAKEVFQELLRSDVSAQSIAEAKNLIQVSDAGAIDEVVEAVLADPASEQPIKDVQAGQEKAIGYLVGQVMKRSQGKANPAMAKDALRRKLGL